MIRLLSVILLAGVALAALVLCNNGPSIINKIKIDEDIQYNSYKISQNEYYGNDEYFFEKADYGAKTAKIEIFRVKSSEELEKVRKRLDPNYKREEGYSLKGFTYFKHDPINNSVECLIFIIDPVIEYSPEFIGHEFTHCIEGSFHPTQG